MKKLTSLFLIGILAALVLGGCSKADEGTGTAGGTTAATGSTTESGSTAATTG